MYLDKAQFKRIKSLSWDEVYKIWENNESDLEHWKIYYKEKGFASWKDWRKKYIDAYKKLNEKWYLIKVENPIASVPNFHGGNYKGWKENIYEGRELPTFSEMKEHSAAGEFLKNFPKETTIIALNTEIGIIIAEGMHRCAAITKAVKENKKLNVDLYIAMTDVKKKEIPDFTKQ